MVKRNKGKSKGSSNERVVATMLDDWWKVPRGTFRRTHHQGSWWKHADVYSTNLRLTDHFPFIIETKFYKKYDLLKSIIDRAKNKDRDLFQKWWNQCFKQYESCLEDLYKFEGKDSFLPLFPLLIFTMNFNPYYVASYRHMFESLKMSDYYDKTTDELFAPYLEISLLSYEDTIVVMSFDKFSKLFRRIS
jgi:hypothetical protein